MSENGDSPTRRHRLARALKRLDVDPRWLKLVRLGRSRLPGDERYGDPLSLTGDQAPAVLGRRLSTPAARAGSGATTSASTSTSPRVWPRRRARARC